MNLHSEVGVGRGKKHASEISISEFLQDVLLSTGGTVPPGPKTCTSPLLGKNEQIGHIGEAPHSCLFWGRAGHEVDQGLYTHTCAFTTMIPSPPCHH